MLQQDPVKEKGNLEINGAYRKAELSLAPSSTLIHEQKLEQMDQGQ
jgi:hypothetical protein